MCILKKVSDLLISYIFYLYAILGLYTLKSDNKKSKDTLDNYE